MSLRVALVAALEREVAPLAKRFARRKDGPEDIAVFEAGGVLLVCGGIGAKRAVAATSWVIASHKPEVVMSIGFAGALVTDFKVGNVITPGTVVDGGTGERFSAGRGNSVLVSADAVLAEARKRELAARFGAQAVDMEAAAVARVARENGVAFLAAKAISDESDFAMPPMDRFVSEAGKFQILKFLAFVSVRPVFWPAVARFGANARKASSQLCEWLENQIGEDFHELRDPATASAR